MQPIIPNETTNEEQREYLGITQFQAALTRPPHLAGLYVEDTPSNIYDGCLYQGGAFEQWLAERVINLDLSVYVDMTISSYTGVAQVAPETEADSTGNSLATYSQSLTTSTDRDWVVMMEGNTGSVYNLSAVSGTVRGTNFPGDTGMLLDSNGPITPAGSTSLSVNMSNSVAFWESVMAAIKPIDD